VNRDPANSTSVRCGSCGAQIETPRSLAAIGRTYQVIVACGICGASLVVLARN